MLNSDFAYKMCIFISIYKLIYKAGAVSFQRRPEPFLVLIAPTHGGMARLSWPEGLHKYWDGRPTKGRYQSQY